MAAKCTADLKDPAKAMLGFGMFYRLYWYTSAPAL